MIEEKISIGCEGSSGGLIISDFNFCRDGVLASALIASAIVKQNESLASIIKSLPQYYCFREKMYCMREEAYRVLKTLSEEEDGNIDSIDGVRIIMNDRSWVLIRSSNTENIIRISVEAKTEKTASELMNRYKDKISKILKEGVKS
jgi:phosphomannomutase